MQFGFVAARFSRLPIQIARATPPGFRAVLQGPQLRALLPSGRQLRPVRLRSIAGSSCSWTIRNFGSLDQGLR